MADWRMNPARFIHRFQHQSRQLPAHRYIGNALSGVFAFGFSLTLGFGVTLLPVGAASATEATPAAAPAPAFPAVLSTPAVPLREVTTAAELMTALTEASMLGEGLGHEIQIGRAHV